jgi:peptidoglycan/LPS O-acetylase OafA/YrhL
VWNTDASPALSVWYLCVLFVFCIATPPLMRLLGNRTSLLVALAALLYALPVPHVIYLDRVARYYVFFALGGLAAVAGERWLTAVDRWTWAALATFSGVLIATLFSAITLTPETSLLVCGVLSMPALHGLIRTPPLCESRGLLTIGTFSFVIYLLNTPCIGLLKGLMLKVMSWDGPNFLLYAPLLMAAGTFGPMLIKRYVLQRVPRLDRMTD